MNNTLELTIPSRSTAVDKPVDVDQFDTVTLELQKYVSQTGLEPIVQQTLAEAFRPVFVKAHAAIAASAGVAESVKDATCVREIKKSRDCRLAIRAVRIEGEKVHKAQKESALRFGKAVDGFKNILLAELGPVEDALDAAEKTAERAEAVRLEALKAQREAELAPLIDGSPILGDLSAMSDDAFAKLLADHRLLKQAKIDAAAKAEADRLAKEAADRAEREMIAAENARLKAEAEATENRLEEERKAREEQARKEREDAEAERQRIEAERKAEREKAKAERLAAEAKAGKEREGIESAAKEAARKAKVEADKLKAELAANAREKANATQQIEIARKAKESALRRAAAAPDREKVKGYLSAVDSVPLPFLSDATLLARLDGQRKAFVNAVEALIVLLDEPQADKQEPLI